MDNEQLIELSFEDVIAENARLQDKVDRLREALGWYADQTHYIANPDDTPYWEPVLKDNGTRARAALKDGE